MARALGWASGFWVLALAVAGCSSTLPAAGPDHVRSAAGGYVLAASPPGMTVRIGSKPLLSAASVATASDRESADIASPPAPR